MKRAFLVAFCILLLCGLLLAMNAGTVIAAYAGYTTSSYQAAAAPTYDGVWTTSTEWNDGAQSTISANAVFRNKWSAADDFSAVWEHFVIELLNDNTNDTGDYWQIIYDGTANGGTAPQSDDIRIDVVGHTNAGIKVYQGTGTGWNQITPSAGQVQMSNSISSSPTSSTAHWVVEIRIEKLSLALQQDPWIRVAAYDASNSAAGVQAWPPTSQDVPSNYGVNTAVLGPIPEGLSLGVVVLLSSFIVLVGSYYFRKRSKQEIWVQ